MVLPVSANPKRRILVVDDNVDVATSLAVLLRLSGHEVHVAHDGATALAVAGPHPPDVAILDIGMPNMNGHDLARRLRALPGLDKVLLIALTGRDNEEDRKQSAAAGFDHHLVKPVSLDEVERALAGA